MGAQRTKGVLFEVPADFTVQDQRPFRSGVR
jgi:hypothetical protein